MLQVHFLGGFSAHDASGASVTLPRHRWALLGIVVAAGERGVSRDKVLAYLWPEVPEDRARARLQQMLHATRVSLHGQLFLPGDPLRVDPAVLWSDIVEFRKAADAGELTHAAAVYRGPFLDGFHLGDPPEFDEWLERERSVLATRWMGIVESLATEARDRRDHLTAVAWWRTLARADPLNSRVAHELMQGLVAAGDRGGAVQHAAMHTAYVQHELGMAADPIVRTFAEQLGDSDVAASSDLHRERGLRLPAIDGPRTDEQSVHRRWSRQRSRIHSERRRRRGAFGAGGPSQLRDRCWPLRLSGAEWPTPVRRSRTSGLPSCRSKTVPGTPATTRSAT